MSTFQILDDKCKNVYYDQIFQPVIPSGLTWKYSSILFDRDDIEYAQLYCQRDLKEMALLFGMEKRYQEVESKINAYYRAIKTSKIDRNKYCLYDLLPEKLVKQYCQIKNDICDQVIQSIAKPKEYDQLLRINKLISDIRLRPIKIDRTVFDRTNEKERKFYDKAGKISPIIDYNQFNIITNRLGVNPKSFPVLNLDKDFRKCIVPTNDMFVSLDFNAAEARVMLALSGKEQFEGDLHQFHLDTIGDPGLDRATVKTQFFAWLFDSVRDRNNLAHEDVFNGLYNKPQIIGKHYDGEYVTTIFDRRIKTDDHHSLNYIIQSTAFDLFAENCFNILLLLRGHKSFISMLITDNVVIDLALEDKPLIRQIKAVFEQTRIGKIPSTLSIGKSFGEMKKVNI